METKYESLKGSTKGIIAIPWPDIDLALYHYTLFHSPQENQLQGSLRPLRCTDVLISEKWDSEEIQFFLIQIACLHVQILLKTIRGWATASVKDDDVDV